MFIRPQFGALTNTYTTTGKLINGATDYYSKASGFMAADSQFFTMCMWLKLGNDEGFAFHQRGAANYDTTVLNINKVWDDGATNNTIQIRLADDTGLVFFSRVSTDFSTHGLSKDDWHLLQFSYDGSAASGPPDFAMYMDGINIDNGGGLSDAPKTHNSSESFKISFGNRDTGTFPVVFDVSEIWMDSSYLDFSQASVRSKFHDVNMKPIYIGDNGENPTGTSPRWYAPDGDITVNLGTGPDNWTETGTVSNSSTSP